MSKVSYRRLTIFALVLAALFLLALRSERPHRLPPRAKGGLLDLSGWNFEKSGLARLDGQWEFLWGSSGQAGHRGPLNPDGPIDQYAVPSLWQEPTALGRSVSSHDPRGAHHLFHRQ